MSQLNDIALVAQVVVLGNKRAFDTLVKKYQSPVRRFFLHQTLGDEELSDDLAQETFIKAYTHLASFKNLSNFSTSFFMTIFALEKKRPDWKTGKRTPLAARSKGTSARRWTFIADWPY